VCDEPTTGLHPDNVERLLRVFDRLIEAGHTVLAVEHNLDFIARADWVIDLDPKAGPAGGGSWPPGRPRRSHHAPHHTPGGRYVTTVQAA